jgi:hypothetical protein
MPEENDKPSADERDDDIFAVRVRATQAQVNELLRRGGFDYGDRVHFSEGRDGIGELDLFVTRAQIEAFRSEGYVVTIASNQSARLRERMGEVGQGDRFEAGRIPPRGLGRKIDGPGPRGQQARRPPGSDGGSEPQS